MDLSIIIPVYNYGKYVEEAVASIYKNKTTYTVQIIIIDDQSTDNSADILTSIGLQYGTTIIKNSENMGVAATRNRGLALAAGEYLMCLDADDYIAGNYIQNHLDNLRSSNCDVSYGDIQYFGGQDSRIQMPQFSAEKLYTTNIVPVSSVFSRKVFISTGGYPAGLTGWEDYDFWLTALEAGATFKHCLDALLYYRRHTGSMITECDKNRTWLLEELKRRHPACII